MLSFFPRGVLDEILNLIESVSEEFPSYSFNLDISKPSASRKVRELCQHFSLDQRINEPTHYTELSSSISDLFLTSNKNNVLLSGVGEPIFDQNIRYHCPVYCVLNFDKISTPVYPRHIWL